MSKIVEISLERMAQVIGIEHEVCADMSERYDTLFCLLQRWESFAPQAVTKILNCTHITMPKMIDFDDVLGWELYDTNDVAQLHFDTSANAMKWKLYHG